MPFAESFAKVTGQTAVAETQLRGMIKAGKTGFIDNLIQSAGGVGGFQNTFQRNNRAREAYRMLRNWVYAATSVVAKRCAGQPWMAGHYEEAPAQGQRRYSKDLIPRGIKRRRSKAYGGADIDPDENHDVLWLLDKPNSFQGRFELVYLTVMNLLLTGEWYWIGGVSKGGKITLYSVPSSWMVPDHSQGLYGGYRLQTGYGEGIPIPAENVARGYFPDPSDIKGCISPLAMCVSAAKIDDYILSSQEASFERGINPNLIITIGQKIGPDGKPLQGSRPVLTGSQRRQITRAVQHIWSQTVNQGNPAILDGLIEDVKKLQMTPQEMDWKQSGEVVKARIFECFGVNPYITGQLTSGNRAQALVAETNFATNVVNPILENISCAASSFFSNFYEDGESLAVWLEQAIPKDEEREDRQWTQARQQGDVTQNEVRTRLGLEEVEQPPERSPIFNNPQVLAQITALAAQVSAGAIPHDEAVQILVTTLQISKGDATKMIPDDPPEPTPEELAAQALAQGGQPGPAGAPGQPPAAGGGQKPPAKPAAKPKPKPEEEPEKAFDPNQPRDENGRWGSGGGGEEVVDEYGGIDEDAYKAFEDWAGTGYKAIRKADEAGKLTPRLKKFLDAAAGLETYKGDAYRGLTMKESEVEETFKVGRKIGVDHIQSFSKSKSIAKDFATPPLMPKGKVSVIIKAKIKDGRDFSKLNRIEKEVLVRHENFKVKRVSVKDTGWGEKLYTVEVH